MLRHFRRAVAAFRSFLVLAAILIHPSAAAFSKPIHGVARIVDGDTVEIAGEKVRLKGIDAPETDQVCLDRTSKLWNCGLSARDALISFVGGRTWDCAIAERDRYGRALGDCKVGGEDVQRWMVRNGWALSFVRYARTYDTDEVEARNRGANLWSGAFIAPWDWRARNQRTVVLGRAVVPANAQAILLGSELASRPATPSCAIKGNVNRKGECIYHMPDTRFYETVKMDLSKGKRWFCTAEEAEAAGCRKPK